MTNLQRTPTFLSPVIPLNPADRMALALRARQCLNWLTISGFEVLGVAKGLDKPRIYIRNSPLCKTLDGAIHRYERGPQGEARYWFALRFDCEVRWNDGEAK